MKARYLLVALVPFAALAQPFNTMNNPNQPGYTIPSQQRMTQQMNTQQIQQKGMLNQQMQMQTQQQNQNLQMQIQQNNQRVRQSQPGELAPGTQQMLPNINGGMLSSGQNNQTAPQTMLPQKHSNQPQVQPDSLNDRQQVLPNVNGGMLHSSGNINTQQHMLPQQ